MANSLRIGLAGLGTVGAGVIRLIEENGDLIARRAGRPIEVVAVTARDRSKDRGIDISRYQWVDDMTALAEQDVDVIVELVGGSDGPALALARAAFENGKSFVTANKAMVAHHGMELAQLAEGNSLALKYEAAVAGGIPVIKGLRDGISANRIERVYGILNGTCNYILTAMEAHGSAFDDVLKDAQDKGYAEADPTFDVDGIDAAHKLSIIASLCFGTKLDFEGVECSGIRKILPADIAQANDLGYRIRLIGHAEIDEVDGKPCLFQRVSPRLVSKDHPLAHVSEATNAVVAEGNYSGRLLFQGAGAGDKPTASAVVADLVDIARGETGPAFAMDAGEMDAVSRAPSGHRRGQAYLRLIVQDRSGVLAEIAAAMRDAGVSIDSLIQRKAGPGEALLAIVTHECAEQAITDTLSALKNTDSLLAEPMVMPLLRG